MINAYLEWNLKYDNFIEFIEKLLCFYIFLTYKDEWDFVVQKPVGFKNYSIAMIEIDQDF